MWEKNPDNGLCGINEDMAPKQRTNHSARIDNKSEWGMWGYQDLPYVYKLRANYLFPSKHFKYVKDGSDWYLCKNISM